MKNKTLDLAIFNQQFEQAQQQLTNFLHQAQQDNAPKSLLTQALDGLTDALEEAHVLSEELAEQYSQLQVAQITLATERQQYFELFDLAPDGYIVTDPTGTIQQINRAATALLNQYQRSLIGKSLATTIAQADIYDFHALFNQLLQGKAFQNISLRLKPYQKQSLYASFTVAPINDHQSQLVGFRWLVRDLTEQRRATIALEESETQYRAIVENQTELICRFLADGRLIFVNQAFCQYFDCFSESVLGENLFNLIGENSQEKRLMQLASLHRLDRNNPIITIDHKVELSDGQVRWQQWNHRALFDDNGKFLQFQSSGRDITDQKYAEDTLQQREAQLSLITDAMPVLLTYINAKQQVLHINRTPKHWLNKSHGDIVGHYLWDVLGPNAYQQIRISVESALSGKRVTFDQAVTLPTQEAFWIRVKFVPDQSDNNQVNGFFALIKRLDPINIEKMSNTSIISG